MVDETDRPLDAALDAALTAPTRSRRRGGRGAESTRVEYAREVRRYEGWCHPEAGDDGHRPRWVTPWPCTSESLATYAKDQAEAGRAPKTIRKAIAAIRSEHRLRGLPVPDGVPALGVLRVHETNLRDAGWEPKHAVPLPFDDVVRLLAVADPARAAGMRDAAMVVLLHALLSPSEVGALDLGDVTIAEDGGDDGGLPRPLEVRLPGRSVLVRHWRTVDGGHHPALCPREVVARLCGYLAGRGAPPASPLLRPVDTHDRVGGLDGRRRGVSGVDGRLGSSGMERVLARLLARAHVADPGRYSLLSVRLCGAETARAHGATNAEVLAAGGWAPTSPHILAVLHAFDERHPSGTVGAYQLSAAHVAALSTPPPLEEGSPDDQ